MNRKIMGTICLRALLAFFTFALLLFVEAGERFEWMPAEAESGSLSVKNSGGEQIIPNIIETQTPKKTADKSKFTRKYIIDLRKFNISNEGRNPIKTANGINAALQDAKALKKNYIIFPKGTYLISETIPIVLDHKNTIIDLNGAVLKLNPNKQPATEMVIFVNGAENLRLTNGTLIGDRYTHDYKTVKSSHEGCRLLVFYSGKNLEVDHIKVEKAAGYAISSKSFGSRTRPELLAMIHHSVRVANLEQGGFSKRGIKKKETEKTRTIKPYDITKCGGEFEFGYLAGYQGYPFIRGRVYQAYFYTPEMNFIKMKKCLQFRKVKIPDGAKFLNLEFNQPEVSDKPAHSGASTGSWIGRINNFKPPTDVHFHDNHIYDNRCLGFAFCGGQKWLFENNLFEKNGPDVVGWAFDFEDGWELMQDIIMRKNKFKDNLKGDVVVCAGSELLFEENEFENGVAVHARPHNYTFRKNKFLGGRVVYTTRTGIAKIHDNLYDNCKTVGIRFDTKAVADGIYRKPGETVSTPPLTLKNEKFINVKKIEGTYFNFINCKLNNVQFIAGDKTRFLSLKGCNLEDTSIIYKKDGPKVITELKKCTGKLVEKGPGLDRKTTMK